MCARKAPTCGAVHVVMVGLLLALARGGSAASAGLRASQRRRQRHALPQLARHHQDQGSHGFQQARDRRRGRLADRGCVPVDLRDPGFRDVTVDGHRGAGSASNANSIYVYHKARVVAVMRFDATVEIDRSAAFSSDRTAVRVVLRADMVLPNARPAGLDELVCAAITVRLKLSEREIRYRIRYAETYATEAQFRRIRRNIGILVGPCRTPVSRARALADLDQVSSDSQSSHRPI